MGLFKIPKPVNIDFSKNIIALEHINDPGNLGTIIRLCDWFGIRDIICSENSADCFNPKTIQASMGSISRVNVTYQSFDDLYANKKYNLIAADIEGEKINDYNFNKNQIIFFGSESNGFSNNLSQKITEKLGLN